jgi:hypothetical protein
MLTFSQYLREFKIEMPPKGAGLGIKRADMPQVASEDYPEYVKHLKANGISLKEGEMNPDDLKPIQKEFAKPKVENSIDKMIESLKSGGKLKPIIVSSDNYVIDGHHRWIAHKNVRMMIPVLKANVKMNKLLKVTHDFPKVGYKDIKA